MNHYSEIRSAIQFWCESGHVYELRVPKAKRRGTISGYFDDLEELARNADVLSDDPDIPAVYLTLNPVLPDLAARRWNETADRCDDSLTKDHEILRRRVLLIDTDPARSAGISSSDPEHAAAIARARQIRDYLTSEGWPLSLLADSGNGGHNQYRIDLPNDDDSTSLVKGVLSALSERFSDSVVKVDVSVFNPSRICKLYGTMTRKGGNHPARPWRRSRIIESPEAFDVVTRDMLEKIAAMTTGKTGTPAAVPVTTSTPRPATPSTKKKVSPDRPGPHTAADVERLMTERNLEYRPVKTWNGGVLWELVACPWAEEHSTGPGGAAVMLVNGWAGWKCQHDSCTRAGRTVRDVLGDDVNGRDGRREGDGIEPGGRPRIITNGRQLRDVTADAVAALQLANDPPNWFLRGGGIVRLSGTTAETARLDMMKQVLAESADWFRANKDGNQAPTYPPDDVVRNVLATPNPPLPTLAGVIGSPVFAPGGRLVSVPGYDPDTGLYLATDLAVDVPDCPTAEDVATARNDLLDLLADFPLVSDSDRAHAVSLLLLPFVRPMIDGPTPIHLIDAPSEGTGKGLLAEVFARLTTGAEAKNTGEPRDDGEWGKVITSGLMSAPPYLFFDNVSRPLHSPNLASATTARTYSDRQLGQSRMVELPVTNVWVMAGNNVHGSREIARRIVRIRLDAGLENPNLRTGFRHPQLIRYVSDRRGELVRSCLVLVRSWVLAGCPKGGKTFGSYEAWAGVMGGILDVVGIAGFLDNLSSTMSEINTSDAENLTLVKLWWAVFGDRPITAAQLCTELDRAGVMLACLEGAKSRPIKLGFKLMNLKDRIIGGKRIERATNPAHNAAAYQLRDVPTDCPPTRSWAGKRTSGPTSGQLRVDEKPYFSSVSCKSPEVPEVYPNPERQKNSDDMWVANSNRPPEPATTSGTSGNSDKTLEIKAFERPEVDPKFPPKFVFPPNFGSDKKWAVQPSDPESDSNGFDSAVQPQTKGGTQPPADPLYERRRESMSMRHEYRGGYIIQPDVNDLTTWRVGRMIDGIPRWLDRTGTKEWAKSEVKRRRDCQT